MILSGFIKSLACLALVAAFTGCAHSKQTTTGKAVSNETTRKPVHALKDVSVTRPSLDKAFTQVKDANAKVVLNFEQPAGSMNAVLWNVQRVAGESVISMVEYEGWYWFANTVVRNDRGTPMVFISGYAVEKGGRELVQFDISQLMIKTPIWLRDQAFDDALNIKSK